VGTAVNAGAENDQIAESSSEAEESQTVADERQKTTSDEGLEEQMEDEQPTEEPTYDAQSANNEEQPLEAINEEAAEQSENELVTIEEQSPSEQEEPQEEQPIIEDETTEEQPLDEIGDEDPAEQPVNEQQPEDEQPADEGQSANEPEELEEELPVEDELEEQPIEQPVEQKPEEEIEEPKPAGGPQKTITEAPGPEVENPGYFRIAEKGVVYATIHAPDPTLLTLSSIENMPNSINLVLRLGGEVVAEVANGQIIFSKSFLVQAGENRIEIHLSGEGRLEQTKLNFSHEVIGETEETVGVTETQGFDMCEQLSESEEEL
jgi:chemotaxis protein histidine kinase CheA